jgi:TatD DNase family protein
MLIDSHCHLNFDELYNDIDHYLQQMTMNEISHALCVGTNIDNWDRIIGIANKYQNIFASVGMHPDEKETSSPLSKGMLLKHTANNKVIAIGETGLDYYRVDDDDISWQHNRFIVHIEAAIEADLPLIIHTRDSIVDTLAILQEHEASRAGAVMHCFTENLDNAKKCLDLGFYISISGIVTFKNAQTIQEVAKYIPIDRLLIETDAPFLAPMPFRGKLNHPALVKHTAEYIANLRGISFDSLGQATSDNFFRLFKKAIATQAICRV